VGDGSGYILSLGIPFFNLEPQVQLNLTGNQQNIFTRSCGSGSKLERWLVYSFLSTVALYDAYGNILRKLFNQINFA
jgi:hypothetical protein